MGVIQPLVFFYLFNIVDNLFDNSEVISFASIEAVLYYTLTTHDKTENRFKATHPQGDLRV